MYCVAQFVGLGGVFEKMLIKCRDEIPEWSFGDKICDADCV
jgi:hypothetical protein